MGSQQDSAGLTNPNLVVASFFDTRTGELESKGKKLAAKEP